MGIRNSTKAILMHQGRILLNKCQSPDIGEYYALPGGGQHQYETMQQAVVRECLEETGYTVIPQGFAAVYEEIFTDDNQREKNPDYAHKIVHIFRCSLADAPQATPTEPDSNQTDFVWVDIDAASGINLLPGFVRQNIRQLCESDAPMYLGLNVVASGRGVG